MQDIPGRTILSIGSVVQGRYIIKNLLGLGGFGAVYLVSDEQVPDKLFALKEVIDPSKQERERFTFECEVLMRLTHPALPRVHAVFEDERNNRAYLLMDYIEGPNLERLRQQQPGRRFTRPQVMTIMAPIVDVITYLHNQYPPIIHRDIKPANIIIPNSGREAVLVDFGIAKEYNSEATTTAMRHCSPGYSAPEQYTRGTDVRTDIYALAATFYTLLTGILPADALQRLTLLASRGIDPLKPVTQLVPALPPTVETAIRHALAINSDDRFPTVEEFWQAVSAHPIGVLPSAAVAGSLGSSTQQPALTPFIHLPALAAPTVSMYRQRRRHHTKKQYGIALSLVAVAMLALLASFTLRASFWSTSDSLALSTPAAPSQIGCDGTITSRTVTPGSVCQVLTTSTTGPTVTTAKAPSTGTTPTTGPSETPSTPEPSMITPTTEPSETPSTPEPDMITPTTEPSETPSTPEPSDETPSTPEPSMTTPEPSMITPTPEPIVIRPFPTARPTVPDQSSPDQSSPTLRSAAAVTSSPSGLIMIAEKSTNASDPGNDKKHKRDKKHGNKIRRRNRIHRVHRTRGASCE